MKYVATNIVSSLDETPTALRKKVAEKLGVSSTGLRITVVRREWRRGKTGGYLSLDVEAETNEFIHNTAFFSNESEIGELPQTTLKHRPVVIGFGVAGVIAAYLLADLGLKPLVLEAGQSLSVRESSVKSGGVHFGEGEGGRAAYTGMLFTPASFDPGLRDILAKEGILFESVDAHQYLPPAFIKSMVKKLHMAILRKGGEVLFQSRFLEIKTFLGSIKGVYYQSEGVRKFVKTSRVIVTNGTFDDSFYLGFCLESSLRKYNEFIYGRPLVDAKMPTYFATSYCAPSKGEKAVLLTGLPRPALLDVGSQSETLSQAFEFSYRGKNATSYLGLRVDKEMANRIAKEAYFLGKPYSIPCSTVGDFLSRKDPLKLGTVKPLDIGRINLTNLNRLYATTSASLEKALSQFGRAFPYLLQRDALVEGMILLRGNEDNSMENYAAKGIHVPSVAPTRSLDFADVSVASYRAVASMCAHVRKAH